MMSSNTEEDCTICAEPIKNYEPEYFDGVEMNPACDNCKSPAFKTKIPSEQLSNVATEPTDMDSTPVNNTSFDFNIMNHTSLEPNRLSHTTTMEAFLQLTTNSSATNSLELTRSEPSNCELSSQVPAGSIQRTSTKTPPDPLLEDLLKGLKMATQDFSSKLDESNLRYLDIRDTLRKQSS